MDERAKYSLLIERYLDGEMDHEQARAFLRELGENNDLAREFQFELDMNRAISDQDMIDLRNKISGVLRQSSQRRTGLVRHLVSSPYRIAAAASVIILVAAAFFIFLMPQKTTSDRLFHTYYDSDQPLRITRSNSELIEALRNYQNKDYEKAIEQFNIILLNDPDNSAVRFYTSISYIETKQFDQAITYLTDISTNNRSAYQKPSEWFLALCYLKIGKQPEAADLFRQIAGDNSHDYQDDAKRILKEIGHLN